MVISTTARLYPPKSKIRAGCRFWGDSRGWTPALTNTNRAARPRLTFPLRSHLRTMLCATPKCPWTIPSTSKRHTISWQKHLATRTSWIIKCQLGWSSQRLVDLLPFHRNHNKSRHKTAQASWLLIRRTAMLRHRKLQTCLKIRAWVLFLTSRWRHNLSFRGIFI